MAAMIQSVTELLGLEGTSPGDIFDPVFLCPFLLGFLVLHLFFKGHRLGGAPVNTDSKLVDVWDEATSVETTTSTACGLPVCEAAEQEAVKVQEEVQESVEASISTTVHDEQEHEAPAMAVAADAPVIAAVEPLVLSSVISTDNDSQLKDITTDTSEEPHLLVPEQVAPPELCASTDITAKVEELWDSIDVTQEESSPTESEGIEEASEEETEEVKVLEDIEVLSKPITPWVCPLAIAALDEQAVPTAAPLTLQLPPRLDTFERPLQPLQVQLQMQLGSPLKKKVDSNPKDRQRRGRGCRGGGGSKGSDCVSTPKVFASMPSALKATNAPPSKVADKVEGDLRKAADSDDWWRNAAAKSAARKDADCAEKKIPGSTPSSKVDGSWRTVGETKERPGYKAKTSWEERLSQLKFATQPARITALVDELSPHAETAREFTHLITSLSRTSQWKKAVELLDEMYRRKIEPDSYVFNAAISACAKNKQLDRALQLLRDMGKHGLEPGRVTYNAAISACEKGGFWDKALSLKKEMEGRGLIGDVITYNSTISACEKGGQWARALELKTEMETRGVRPDVITFSALISACGKGLQCDQALELLVEMKSKGVNPDVITYSAAISACHRGGRWEEALRLLESIKASGLEPNVVSYSAAISACEKGSQWEHALRLLKEMKALHVEPNVVTYSAAISACDKGRQWSHALALLKEMRERGVQPNVVSFNAAASACSRAGMWEETVTLLREMRESGLQPCCLSYNSALWACEKAKQPQEALSLLSSMQRHGVAPNVGSFAAVIGTCAKAGRWDDILRLLDDMEHAQVQPDSATISLAIQACEQRELWQRASTLRSRVKRTGRTETTRSESSQGSWRSEETTWRQ